MQKAPCGLLAMVLLCGVAQAADAPRYVGRLPQGTVELVGVTYHRPTRQSQWWRPDGSAATLGPFCPLQKYNPGPSNHAGTNAFTFLLRFENLPADASKDPVSGVSSSTTPFWYGGLAGMPWQASLNASSVTYFVRGPNNLRITGSTDLLAGQPAWAAMSGYDVLSQPGERASDNTDASPPGTANGMSDCSPGGMTPSFYKMSASVLLASAAATDLRVGVNMGEWETVITQTPDRGGTSSFTRDDQEWAVTFSKPAARHSATEGDTTQVVLKSTYTHGNWTKRLVAATHDGREQIARIGTLTSGDIGPAVFRNLPLDSIKEFRLQLRPYHFVEFHNISLYPGQATVVQVLSPDAPASDEGLRTGRGPNTP